MVPYQQDQQRQLMDMVLGHVGLDTQRWNDESKFWRDRVDQMQAQLDCLREVQFKYTNLKQRYEESQVQVKALEQQMQHRNDVCKAQNKALEQQVQTLKDQLERTKRKRTAPTLERASSSSSGSSSTAKRAKIYGSAVEPNDLLKEDGTYVTDIQARWSKNHIAVGLFVRVVKSRNNIMMYYLKDNDGVYKWMVPTDGQKKFNGIYMTGGWRKIPDDTRPEDYKRQIQNHGQRKYHDRMHVVAV